MRCVLGCSTGKSNAVRLLSHAWMIFTWEKYVRSQSYLFLLASILKTPALYIVMFILSDNPRRVERICRETLDSIVALSMEVVLFRNYSEHTREPDATAAEQDPMPRRLWMDMKWTFSRHVDNNRIVLVFLVDIEQF